MILYCSAWEPEIKHLEKENKLALGIGFLEASLKLERYFLDEKPEKVIFLGTAGAYDKNIELNQIIEIAEVKLLNSSSLFDEAYIPQDYKTYKSAPKEKNICFSSLEITKSEKLSEKILSLESHTNVFENMELYGIAKVCQENNIPWQAFLAITNHTHEKGHEEWKANHLSLSEKLCKQFNS